MRHKIRLNLFYFIFVVLAQLVLSCFTLPYHRSSVYSIIHIRFAPYIKYKIIENNGFAEILIALFYDYEHRSARSCIEMKTHLFVRKHLSKSNALSIMKNTALMQKF